MTTIGKLSILLLAFFGASTATIYKSEDEFGRPVFSNRADENPEKVKLKEPTTYENHQPATPLRSSTPKI